MPIAYAAGLVLLGDVMIVAGSTTGQGQGLGVNDGNSDMDGFITKLFRSDGSLYGQTEETAGKSISSTRIATQTNKTDYIFGICADPSGTGREHVYVVGATTGHEFRAPGNNNTSVTNAAGALQAFLLRIDVETLEIKQAVQLGTVDNQGPAVGLACACTPDGEYVYLAGNVQQGAVMQGPGPERKSGGKSDVFVARIQAGGNTEWVQQLGSAADDVLAPRGGLAVTAEGKVVLVGNTQGSLYRQKPTQTADSSTEVFVAVVTAEGHIPEQVVPLPTPPPATTPPTVANNNTGTVTAAPTQVQASTTAPTSAPVVKVDPTMAPSEPRQSFDFQGMTIRLTGAPELKDLGKQVFEETMREFYEEMIYKDRRQRRRLQEVSDFKTTVKFHDQEVDDTGNTVTYHQRIHFISNADTVTEEQAQNIIVKPFTDGEQLQSFVTLLGQNNDDFKSVTAVGDPQFAGDSQNTEGPKKSSSDDDGGLDMMLFIYIGAGIFMCCVCAGWYAMRRKKTPLLGDTDESYDPDRDMYDRPEQPRDNSGKNDDIPQPDRMSFIGNDDAFHDEMSAGSGPTAGFGNDFDQPEKRRPNINDADEEDDFGIPGVGPSSADNGLFEGRDRKNSEDSGSGSGATLHSFTPSSTFLEWVF